MSTSETTFTFSVATFERVMGFAIRHGLDTHDVEDLTAILQSAMRDAHECPAVTVIDEPHPEQDTFTAKINSDYLSPQAGVDRENAHQARWTVVGYLAAFHPEILDNMDVTPDATQRDGWWLMHRCRERGIEPIKVVAPPVLQDQGVDYVNAYPRHLLTERFGG